MADEIAKEETIKRWFSHYWQCINQHNFNRQLEFYVIPLLVMEHTLDS